MSNRSGESVAAKASNGGSGVPRFGFLFKAAGDPGAQDATEPLRLTTNEVELLRVPPVAQGKSYFLRQGAQWAPTDLVLPDDLS